MNLLDNAVILCVGQSGSFRICFAKLFIIYMASRIHFVLPSRLIVVFHSATILTECNFDTQGVSYVLDTTHLAIDLIIELV